MASSSDFCINCKEGRGKKTAKEDGEEQNIVAGLARSGLPTNYITLLMADKDASRKNARCSWWHPLFVGLLLAIPLKSKLAFIVIGPWLTQH